MRSKVSVQSTTLAAFVFVVSVKALGAPADAKSQAGTLFEQGVRQFASGQYEPAAKAFLGADDLIPSSRALINAITAARRGHLYLLEARAAERALARPDMDASGTSFARDAIADAAPNLSVVQATCAPAPCAVTLDGAPVESTHEYVLPGTHELAATGGDGAAASQQLHCEARATYPVSLALQPRQDEKAPPVVAPPAPAVAKSVPERRSAPRSENEHVKPLPPAVFIAGAAGTAVLIALTTWSGVDTLSAKSAAQSDPESWPHVKSRALRTDLLLSGAIVLGAATGVAGLWFVNWGGGQRATAVILPGGGAAFAAEGHF